MLVLQKIWRALFSYNTCFEIHVFFALLLMNFYLVKSYYALYEKFRNTEFFLVLIFRIWIFTE